MKVSEVIKRLEELKGEKGDIDIKFLGVNGGGFFQWRKCRDFSIEKFYGPDEECMVLCGIKD